jgi:hypothetical protein
VRNDSCGSGEKISPNEWRREAHNDEGVEGEAKRGEELREGLCEPSIGGR